MNALINAFNSKKKLILANDGRLLKKSFFGLIIIALAFQGGEFGEIIRNSMVDAYIQVSVFVAFTLFVFIGLDSLTKYDIKSFLAKTKKFHVPIAAFLGAIPEPFIDMAFLLFILIIEKQSPPIPVEPGSTTDKTAEAAIAASTALPPIFSIFIAS